MRISWISKEKAGGKHQHFRRRGDFKIAPGTASAHPIYVGSKKRVGGILNHLLSAAVLLGLQWSQALVAMNSVILCKPADLPGGKDVALLCSRILRDVIDYFRNTKSVNCNKTYHQANEA